MNLEISFNDLHCLKIQINKNSLPIHRNNIPKLQIQQCSLKPKKSLITTTKKYPCCDVVFSFASFTQIRVILVENIPTEKNVTIRLNYRQVCGTFSQYLLKFELLDHCVKFHPG